MTRINEVYAAIKKDPSLLSSLSETENTEAVPTRAMPGLSDSAVTDALREILGQNASDQEVNEVKQELENNNLFKLYKASDGTIDAGELLQYAGELDGSEVSKDNTALRALFDGKLDLKEILLIILLLKLFKKKKQQQQTATNPLQSLFGTQQQTATNPLQSLFGTAQPQPSSNVYTIYGNNGNSGSNSLLSLFGLTGSQPNYNNASNNLFNFVNGNNVSQAPLQSLYSLLDQAPANTVSSSGQINVGTLFSILNTLLKK